MRWPTKKSDRVCASLLIAWIASAPGLIAWGYVAGWNAWMLCGFEISWWIATFFTASSLHAEARKAVPAKAPMIQINALTTPPGAEWIAKVEKAMDKLVPEAPPPPPLIPEQEVLVTGWRGFKLGAGPWLYSLHVEAPPWSKTMIASCPDPTRKGEDIYAARDRTILHLSDPNNPCRCGIYAYRDAQRLFRNETCRVWGEVRLEGVVLIHIDGFRAEKATIERLWVDPALIVPEFDLVAHLKKEYDCPVDVARWGSFEVDPKLGALDFELQTMTDPRGPATWFANNPYLGGSNLKSAAVSPPRSGPSVSAPLPSPPRLNPIIQNVSYRTWQTPDLDTLCDIDLKLSVLVARSDPMGFPDLNRLIDELVAGKHLLPGTHATPSVRTVPNQPTITMPWPKSGVPKSGTATKLFGSSLTADEWEGGTIGASGGIVPLPDLTAAAEESQPEEAEVEDA